MNGSFYSEVLAILINSMSRKLQAQRIALPETFSPFSVAAEKEGHIIRGYFFVVCQREANIVTRLHKSVRRSAKYAKEKKIVVKPAAFVMSFSCFQL